MKKCINGKFVEVTKEEIAAMQQAEDYVPVPTDEERIAALEAAMLELAEVIANG